MDELENSLPEVPITLGRKGPEPFPKGSPVTLTRPLMSKGKELFPAGARVFIMKGYENGSFVPVTDGWKYAITAKATL